MTPDQFFDELDKVFGCDDGYIHHLKRIKELKEEKDGWKAARDDDIREAVGEASDVLAQKFYDHYGGQGADTLNFARQTGPDLGNMVDYVLKENKELEEKVSQAMDDLDEVVIEKNELKERLDIMKATASTHIQEINEVHKEYGDMVRDLKAENKKLKEQIEEAHQEGYDEGQLEGSVDREILDDYQKVLDYMTGHKDCDVSGEHSDWIIEEIKELKENYDRLRSVHSKVVQDLNARTEKVIEMTLQQQ